MIILTKGHLREMEDHAKKERPNEACGVLAGRGSDVKRIYRCRNVSENPSSRYTIAPERLLEVFNDVEERGLEILGFYHSHPSGPSAPSNVDHATATWHGHSYVILHPHGINSWKWDEKNKKFTKEKVQII